ncbi:Up-regulated during septation-domain-containing protein [Pilobolus umbonatus]|nr:Up-regulated during septation-domain-containing protein [Pilobolus umbonatus]
MIPIMPSKSTDDDRPMGLKFTRNNYFGFPKSSSNENGYNGLKLSATSNQRTTPPTLPAANGQPMFRRDYEEAEPFHSSHLLNGSYDSPFSSPPPRPIHSPPARPTHSPPARPIHSPPARPTQSPTSRSTQSPPTRPTQSPPTRPTQSPPARPTQSPTTRPTQTATVSTPLPSTISTGISSFASNAMPSPTLPARSPFRIRDSQLSAATSSRIISSHDIYSKPSNHEDLSAYSPITSPSTTNSSAADDDLTFELETIWKLKPHMEPLKEPGHPKIDSDEMLTQLLISQAIIDAKEYKMLTFDEIESLKEHHGRLTTQIGHSSNKFELEKKIQETSHSLSNLTPHTIMNNQRHSVLMLRDDAVEADRKVSELSRRLNDLKAEEIEAQYKILQHTAAVLSHGLQQIEKNQQVSSPRHTSHGSFTSKQQDERVTELRLQIDNITSSLTTILKRYNSSVDATSGSPMLLLDHLEKHLAQYKSDTRVLESKLETIEEKYRLESIAEKKLEIQLRVAHEKKGLAEQRYKNLEKEFDEFKEKNQTNNMDWLNAHISDLKDDGQIKLNEIEEQLVEAKEKQYKAERELEIGYEEVNKLKSMVTDMEIKESKAQSELLVCQNKENALKAELEQYKDEVFQSRAEKEKWEKMMKRQTVIQLMDGGNSLTDKYEQQLEEQEQEYQAQLKEQAALLNKTLRQCDKLQQDYEKLVATCSDLELLIKDKTRILDSRDIQITQLESELRERRMATVDNKPDNSNALKEVQAAFSEKEAEWIEQSASMEANFEGILKEFDRLTGTAMEFESDKMNYERRIDELTKEIRQLENDLSDEKARNVGLQSDTPTTASLRREFRKMINDMKMDHQRILEREAEEKKKLERQLKDMKHERDMSRYERINKGVQTLFIA